jgi:tetratricopeptide (TPR) repeat protein
MQRFVSESAAVSFDGPLASARRLRWWWFVVACLLAAGCSGSSGSSSSGGGPSIAEQIAQAQAEPDAEVRARRLMDAGRRQAASGDVLGAEKTFAEASRACATIADPHARATIYIELIKALVETGGRVAARKAADDAAAATDAVADDELRAETLAALAAARQTMGDLSGAAALLDRAELLARELSNAEGKIRVLAGVAVVYQVRMANTDEARRVLHAATRMAGEMTDLPAQSRSLGTIAYAWHRCGQFSDADQAFESAAESARQIEVPFARGYNLAGVAEQAFKANRKPQAAALLDEAEQFAPKIPEPDLRQQLLQKVRELRARL